MARPGSRQVAGYFPTPPDLLPSLASLITWPEVPGPFRATWIFDPCAGEGYAVATLRDLWVASWAEEAARRPPEREPQEPRIVACEMEAGRARELRERLQPSDPVLAADAFCLVADIPEDGGASVLFLNPPYDHDPEHGRLEQRFLSRFTSYLHPGSGLLLYVVPGPGLAASADFLARHYLDLQVFRFPDPHFATFGQLVAVGRRTARPLAAGPQAEEIRRGAAAPETLPVLPENPERPLAVDLSPPYQLHVQVEAVDLTATLGTLEPPSPQLFGLDIPADELLGRRYETAIPPKPAHIALALSTGAFNGHVLSPNDPERHPPVLAKGVFEREPVVIGERTNGEGEVTGLIEVERPRLRLTILDLSTYLFHELAPGTTPAGGDDPSRWNAADLIAHYDQALTELLAEQFPAIHDPSNPGHALLLPDLPRKPFRVQAEAIQAALKLFALGRNPFLVAEVGTGKTTMALYVAAALSPRYREATVAQLRRLGFAGRLPTVRKTLVLAPPHLLESWKDQAAVVVPEWRVRIVRSAEDLQAEAELYILSREAAKLGHGWEGVEGACPRCGSLLPENAATNASRRLRCRARLRRPRNVPARLAQTLAALLAPAVPTSSLVQSSAPGRRVEERYLEDPSPRPLPLRRLREWQRSYLHFVEVHLRKGREEAESWSSGDLYRLLDGLPPLARALGTEEETRRELRRLLAHVSHDAQATDSWGPAGWLGSTLRQLEEEVSPPSDDEKEAAFARILEALYHLGVWEESPPCGEPLFQAVPRPRRFPLAQHILRKHRRDFQALLMDEGHEFNHSSSAQSKAAHRLTGLPGVVTLVLTGSLMNGYASSLFANFWALSPLFREELGRDEGHRFVGRYGYLKTERRVKISEGSGSRGRHTDRELGRRKIGEAPGVSPDFLMRHQLPTAILVHKSDLETELPPLTETPVALDLREDDLPGQELLTEYQRLEALLLERIRKERFDPDLAGRLLGALVELPSYLDRATDDQPPFEIAYPESVGGEVLAKGQQLSSLETTPKERWLLGQIEEQLGRGRRVLVFLRHTGTPHLARRLLGLLSGLTERAAFLDAARVPTHRREAWINQEVLAKEVEVLLVNPNAVRTGLNNLVAFSVGLWHELDYSAATYRQANGRLHRIGQTQPVEILLPYYRGTAQEVAFDLVAQKVTASLQVDGLDLQAALEAAGASEEEAGSVETAMSLGQAVYRA